MLMSNDLKTSVSEESLEQYINEQRTYLQNLNITERDKNGNLKNIERYI